MHIAKAGDLLHAEALFQGFLDCTEGDLLSFLV